MAFTDAEYLRFDPYADECEVKCRTVKMVTTRKPQTCYCPAGKVHDIPAGTRARFEHAIVEGKWASYYTCIPCCDYGLTFDHPHGAHGCEGEHAESA